MKSVAGTSEVRFKSLAYFEFIMSVIFDLNAEALAASKIVPFTDIQDDNFFFNLLKLTSFSSVEYSSKKD